MEIQDFAAALRAMADNVDVLAEQHDVARMAQLRREAADHVVQARRDQDLIDELRRQLRYAHRSLDAIGRLRKNHLTEPADAVQILVEALLMVEGPCSNYTDPFNCRAAGGRTRGARYASDAWCGPCVTRDALERVGALPPAMSGRTFTDDEEPPFGERIELRNAEDFRVVWNGKRWHEKGYDRSLTMHDTWPPSSQGYEGPWFEVEPEVKP